MIHASVSDSLSNNRDHVGGGRTTTLTEAEAPVSVADSRFLDSTIHGTCFGRTMEKHRAGEDEKFFLVAIVGLSSFPGRGRV